MRFSNEMLERMAAEHRRNANPASAMGWPSNTKRNPNAAMQYRQRQTDLAEMIEELLDWRMRHFMLDAVERRGNGESGKIAQVL